MEEIVNVPPHLGVHQPVHHLEGGQLRLYHRRAADRSCSLQAVLSGQQSHPKNKVFKGTEYDISSDPSIQRYPSKPWLIKYELDINVYKFEN